MRILDSTGKSFPIEQPSVEGEPSYVKFEDDDEPDIFSLGISLKESISPWWVIITFGLIMIATVIMTILVLLRVIV